MLSSLPSLAPRDSHALWYTSSHSSDDGQAHSDALTHSFDPLNQSSALHPNSHLHRRTPVVRSPLAQLRADELLLERRKQNVQNYGSTWIKPPGIQRSLHQAREEDREMKEHQEALRREQLAQELAEAEAADMIPEDDLLGPNLDDEIPDADEPGTGPDDLDEDEEEESEDEVPHVLAQHTDEMYRNALMGDDGFGAGGGLGSDVEDPSQMLEEEDLVHDVSLNMDADLDMDVDMSADLDGSVPDAEISGYEHTDTDDELSSSEASGSEP